MSKRIKGTLIPRSQVERMMTHESGSTVALSYEAWPDWAKRARDPNVDYILFCPSGASQGGKGCDFDEVVGRMTVIREDPKDVIKGILYNKDVYVFVCANDSSVTQYGPFKKGDPDHWMPFLYDDYKGWPVVGDTSEKD